MGTTPARFKLRAAPGTGETLTALASLCPRVTQTNLLWGLVVVFAAIAVGQVVLGVLYTPVLFVVALPFAAAAYLLWYHVSGRMASNVRTRVRARPSWEDARAEARARGEPFTGDRRRRAPPADDRMAPSAAYEALGLDSDASDAEIQRAYREKVKETHPDRQGGDEEAFKRVSEAYRRLKTD